MEGGVVSLILSRAAVLSKKDERQDENMNAHNEVRSTNNKHNGAPLPGGVAARYIPDKRPRCYRSGCNKPVPSGRTDDFCSEACAETYQRELEAEERELDKLEYEGYEHEDEDAELEASIAAAERDGPESDGEREEPKRGPKPTARVELQLEPAKRPQRAEETTVCTARREARAGEKCNPWLDHGKYSPLPDWIAGWADLSAGDKKFYAAYLRRVLTCGGRLPLDKLAAETATTRWKVNARIRKFVKMHLVQRDRFGNLHLLDPGGKRRLGVKAGKQEYASRIPVELMTAGVPDAEVIVYARLAGLSGAKGWWFGTNTQLAEACGCSLNALRAAVHGLEAAKLIRVDRHGAGAGKRSRYQHGGGSNVYWFLGHSMFARNGWKMRGGS
jgi:hypothetical protein